MPRLIKALWTGEMPLAEAFWAYGIAVGSCVNLAATLLALALLTKEAPGYIAVLIFVIPIPYNVFMLVAVWRSAGNYQGREVWAILARAAIILWAIAASSL